MEDIESIMDDFKRGKINKKQFIQLLYQNDILKIADFAKIDLSRNLRCGTPEVILAEGKRKEEVVEIVKSVVESGKKVIVSRIGDEFVHELEKLGFPLVWEKMARMVIVSKEKKGKETAKKDYTKKGLVGIITAGTADIPVAEEVRVICREFGCGVLTGYDVGVAGLQRLAGVMKEFIQKKVDVYVVIAGRDGALPSVVAGMIDAPVIGVPTSNGYGMGGGGKAALLAMLQSCSPLAVVNIDAGFVAGVIGSKIAERISRKE